MNHAQRLDVTIHSPMPMRSPSARASAAAKQCSIGLWRMLQLRSCAKHKYSYSSASLLSLRRCSSERCGSAMRTQTPFWAEIILGKSRLHCTVCEPALITCAYAGLGTAAPCGAGGAGRCWLPTWSVASRSLRSTLLERCSACSCACSCSLSFWSLFCARCSVSKSKLNDQNDQPHHVTSDPSCAFFQETGAFMHARRASKHRGDVCTLACAEASTSHRHRATCGAARPLEEHVRCV